MTSAPIVVHRLSTTGGRRVTARAGDVDEILGVAYSDHDVLEFLRRIGIEEPGTLLDQPRWGHGAAANPTSGPPHPEPGHVSSSPLRTAPAPL